TRFSRDWSSDVCSSDLIIGEADNITVITTAIDKLDKIGVEKVNEELNQAGITDEAIKKLQPILQLSGTTGEKLVKLRGLFEASRSEERRVGKECRCGRA